MSMTFTKLFSSITESTVWCEPDSVRIVWITMLAMADKHGRVWGSVPGVANRARVGVEDARAALNRFLEPDPDSRTKEHEGRRIEVIDGGWRLLNYAKYRAVRDEEDRRAYKAEHEAKRRAAAKRGQVSGQNGQLWTDVDPDGLNADAEAEALNPLKPPSRGAEDLEEKLASYNAIRARMKPKPLPPLTMDELVKLEATVPAGATGTESPGSRRRRRS